MNKKIISLAVASVLLLSSVAGAIGTTTGNTSNLTFNTHSTATSNAKQGEDIGTQALNPGGTLKLALGTYVESLNPLQSTSAYDMNIRTHIFESLLGGNPHTPFNQKIETFPPQIAKDVNVTHPTLSGVSLPSQNGTEVTLHNATVYTYALNEGYRFQDGTEITADDVVFSANLIKWLDINNAGDMYMNTMTQAKWIKTKKLNRYTVQTILNTTSFISRLYGRDFIIYPSHIYGKASTWVDGANGTFMSDYAGLTDGWYNPGWDLEAKTDVIQYIPENADDPILTGSGPYILDVMSGDTPKTSSRFELVKNTNYFYYPRNTTTGDILTEDPHPDILGGPAWERPTEDNWDPYGPYMDKIVYKVIERAPILVEALKSDKGIDFSTSLDLSRYVSDLSDAGFEFKRTDRMGYGYLGLQCHNNTGNTAIPTSVPKFRQAVAQALSKLDVINKDFNGYAYPLEDPVPDAYPSDWNYKGPASRKRANPAKARELLEAAGYDDTNGDGWYDFPGANDTNIELDFEITNVESIVNNIGDPIRNRLEDAGIKVDFSPVTFNKLLADLRAGAYDATFLAFTLSYVPTILSIFYTKSPANQHWYFRFSNATYDKYYHQFMNGNLTQAKEASRKMQKVLYWQQPQVPIYQNILLSAYEADQYSGYINLYGAGLTGTDTAQFYNALKLIRGEAPGVVGNPPIANTTLHGETDSKEVRDPVTNRTVTWIETDKDHVTYYINVTDPEGNFSDLAQGDILLSLDGKLKAGDMRNVTLEESDTLDLAYWRDNSTFKLTIDKPSHHTSTIILEGDTGLVSTVYLETVVGYNTNWYAPTVTISYPASGAEISGTLTVNGTAFDRGIPESLGGNISEVLVRIDDGTWHTATYNATTETWTIDIGVGSLSAGTHAITVKAVDNADPDVGEPEPLTATATIMVTKPAPALNTHAPTISIDQPSSGAEVSDNITVSGTASDADSGEIIPGGNVTSVQVKVDDGNWTDATYNASTEEWSINLDTADWSIGKHTITVRAMDGGDPALSTIAAVTVKIPEEPTPLTRQPTFLVSISTIITAIVVGAGVYMFMRRKVPPAE